MKHVGLLEVLSSEGTLRSARRETVKSAITDWTHDSSPIAIGPAMAVATLRAVTVETAFSSGRVEVRFVVDKVAGTGSVLFASSSVLSCQYHPTMALHAHMSPGG
jgi:hypothetical protein